RTMEEGSPKRRERDAADRCRQLPREALRRTRRRVDVITDGRKVVERRLVVECRGTRRHLERAAVRTAKAMPIRVILLPGRVSTVHAPDRAHRIVSNGAYMAKVTIVGAGHSGLQLGIGLVQAGHDVKVISNRTPEAVERGKVM